MFDMDQPKFDINCKIPYKLFCSQGVQISTDSPETKRNYPMLPGLSGKMSKQYFVK